ncbi:hypothetical protein BST81_25135 [Leptolyngbya sp. 'hensonii']|nr:hypothetical protein BST81_25135 [Leptolyngbya sp. 'hensonii']
MSYEEKRAQGRDRFRRIITLISLISFGGSISTGIVHTFSQASDADKPIQAVQQTEQLRRQQFSAEEQGYLIVLKREPNNQVALDGLAAVRIKMHDWKGAIEPLEKLVALNPGREDWKTLLENIKRRANQK